MLDLNASGPLALYVDGADECDPHRRLIKGGGAALTREKIIAEASKQFVCIIDASKQVPLLGRFPVPVEVIPMARSLVARELSSSAASRSGAKAWSPTTATGSSTCTTGSSPIRWRWSNREPDHGVVTVGLFARRPADVVVVDGVVRV